MSAYARKGEVFFSKHTTPNGRGLLCYIVWRVSHDLVTAYNATAPPPVSFTDSMDSFRGVRAISMKGQYVFDGWHNLKLESYVIFASSYSAKAVTY